MTESVHASAVFYLALGLAVLPLHRPVERGGRRLCSCGKADCPSPAKHPVGRLAPRGLLDASRERTIIDRWFGGADWNIGIATGAASGIVALDIDPRHGGDESLRTLEARHGALPETWRFLTGGGGEHILFRHPGGVVKNSSGALSAGIDGRGDGGYIVAPPSEHMSGRPYAISVDHHPNEVALADVPEWLAAQMREPVAASKGKLRIGSDPVDWRAHLGGMVGEGERNMALARTAGLLLGRGLDPHACLDLLLAFNEVRCRPPLSPREVVMTVASIAKREQSNRRVVRSGDPAHG